MILDDEAKKMILWTIEDTIRYLRNTSIIVETLSKYIDDESITGEDAEIIRQAFDELSKITTHLNSLIEGK